MDNNLVNHEKIDTFFDSPEDTQILNEPYFRKGLRRVVICVFFGIFSGAMTPFLAEFLPTVLVILPMGIFILAALDGMALMVHGGSLLTFFSNNLHLPEKRLERARKKEAAYLGKKQQRYPARRLTPTEELSEADLSVLKRSIDRRWNLLALLRTAALGITAAVLMINDYEGPGIYTAVFGGVGLVIELIARALSEPTRQAMVRAQIRLGVTKDGREDYLIREREARAAAEEKKDRRAAKKAAAQTEKAKRLRLRAAKGNAAEAPAAETLPEWLKKRAARAVKKTRWIILSVCTLPLLPAGILMLVLKPGSEIFWGVSGALMLFTGFMTFVFVGIFIVGLGNVSVPAMQREICRHPEDYTEQKR
ncbi:MAG: hypothetical protein IJK40_02410 [Clostridia bacterium]|nr:hypothetical protein [Clostridia bacterium]